MKTQTSLAVVFPKVFAVLLGVSVGISIQAWRTLEKPQEFVSVAKLVSTIESDPNFDSTYLKEPPLYISVIETLESEEMARRTRNRVSVLHPEWASNSIKIEASKSRGSLFYQVKATGTDPKYTKYALNSLIDEFLNMCEDKRRRMGASGNGVIILEHASSAVQLPKNWMISIGNGALVGGMLALATVFSLRRLFLPSPALSAQ